jgi:putative DNA primase/helicase
MGKEELKQEIIALKDAGLPREKAALYVSALPTNGEDADESLRLVDLIYSQAEHEKAVDFHLTDAGNSEYFANLYSERLRYDHRRKRWLEWDGCRWHEDTDGRVVRLALAAARNRYKGAIETQDLEERKKISAWAIGSEAKARLESTIAIGKNLHPIADSGEDWDVDPWLFCVKNGIINLRTGELREGQQSDKITYQAPVIYDPKAKAPRWVSFLSEIFSDDGELIAWLQKFLGYSLTGDTREQIVTIGYGRGANGKTKLLAALRHVLGDYACDAGFSTFELHDRAAIPNDLAALVGRRLVTASETNEGARLNEARIKALSGGDSISARFLHAEFFTFQPVCKIFLAVNHRPRVYDDSYGFWRRVRLLPFNREFKGAGDDKLLLEKLVAESSGILNWLIEGCQKWQAEGLELVPEVISQATTEYQTDSDPLSQFILDQCGVQPQARVRASDFYKEYLDWCVDQGLREKEKVTCTAFGRRMGQKFKKLHDRDGTFYAGVGLKRDGFVTSSEPRGEKSQLISPLGSRVGDKPENTSQPINPSQSDIWDNMPDYPNKPCPVCGGSDYWPDFRGKRFVCSRCHPQPEERSENSSEN